MAEDIEFQSENEHWNLYTLVDGTTLKLKTVLAEVLRVDGEYAPNGDPLYVVNASTIVSSVSPEHMKKKA